MRKGSALPLALATATAFTAGASAGVGQQAAALPGFPSCDYGKSRVVREIDGVGSSLADWSPDGSKIVTTDKFIDVESGKVVGRIPFDGEVARPTWSPDGLTIVFDSDKDNVGPLSSEGEGSDLWAYDLPTGKFTRLTKNVNGSNSYARFAHRTRRLTWVRHGLHGGTRFTPMLADVVRDGDGTTRLANERSLAPADPAHPAHGAFTRPGDFTADETGVVVNSTAGIAGRGGVWRIDIATREWTDLSSAISWEEHPRVSPNGQKLSFTSTRDYPWPGNTGIQINYVGGVPSTLDHVLIVAYAAGFAGEPLFGMSAESYLANPDGSDPRSLTLNTPYGTEGGWFSRNGTFSPDGTRMALSQRPVTQVRVPGLPANTIQVAGGPGNATGVDKRAPRLLVIDFDCNARPRLSLRLRRSGDGVRATVGGQDVGMVRRVDFLAGGRRLARDATPPFTKLLPRARLSRRSTVKVRARVTLERGSRLTLTRTLRLSGAKRG